MVVGPGRLRSELGRAFRYLRRRGEQRCDRGNCGTEVCGEPVRRRRELRKRAIGGRRMRVHWRGMNFSTAVEQCHPLSEKLEAFGVANARLEGGTAREWQRQPQADGRRRALLVRATGFPIPGETMSFLPVFPRRHRAAAPWSAHPEKTALMRYSGRSSAKEGEGLCRIEPALRGKTRPRSVHRDMSFSAGVRQAPGAAECRVGSGGQRWWCAGRPPWPRGHRQ